MYYSIIPKNKKETKEKEFSDFGQYLYHLKLFRNSMTKFISSSLVKNFPNYEIPYISKWTVKKMIN
jgi:hypothetical protein